jgi:Sec-independent protein translocase protein TatA
LPEVAEAFGKSIQKFKRASREVTDELQAGVEGTDDDKDKPKT